MNTIRCLVKGSILKDAQLGNIVRKIKHVLMAIPEVTFWHILRDNNGLVENQANLAMLVEKGVLSVNMRSSKLIIL